MSNYARPPQEGTGVRESLTFEDILRRQVEKCADALSSNNRDYAEATITTLGDLITASLSDEEWLGELADKDDAWDADLAVRMKEYEIKKRKARGGCPDLVDMPSRRPDVNFFRGIYRIHLDLLDRRKMLTRRKVVESL